MNILNRVRDNAHFFITTKRIPPNPQLPLLAILVSVRGRNNPGRIVRFVMREPWRYFPIYNHDTMILPPRLVEKLLAQAGPQFVPLPPGVRGPDGGERLGRREVVIVQNPRWKD
jgi:hypothetical protein